MKDEKGNNEIPVSQSESINPWDGIPVELRILCQLEYTYNDREGMCVEPMLNFLLAHMNDCDDPSKGVTPYDVIYWIDTGIDFCLFPVFSYEYFWLNNSDKILSLLKRSERLIMKSDPQVLENCTKLNENEFYKPALAVLSQKLDVYFAVCYAFRKEWDLFDEKCEALFEATKRNIKALLSLKDCVRIISEIHGFEFRFPGEEPWEPLMWICDECIIDIDLIHILIPYCELYVDYLQELSSDNEYAVEQLRNYAEISLRDLYEMLELLLDDEDDI